MKESKSKKASPELTGLLEAALRGITCDRRMMFGSPIFTINRKMFTGVHQDNIFLRLPEAGCKEIMRAYPGARPFEPRKGLIMKEYITIPEDLYEDKATLAEWLRKAHSFASSLPPKKKRK
ncbi:MAG: TfoX/Sxy family protein [Dehalococcoidia bacterium]|nr:TfoX/Sxy family protein [Dehalococcoidia bacterium]